MFLVAVLHLGSPRSTHECAHVHCCQMSPGHVSCFCELETVCGSSVQLLKFLSWKVADVIGYKEMAGKAWSKYNASLAIEAALGNYMQSDKKVK